MNVQIETGMYHVKGMNRTIREIEQWGLNCRKDLPEEPFELIPEGSEEASKAKNKEKSFPGGRNCLCKCPEAERSLGHPGNKRPPVWLEQDWKLKMTRSGGTTWAVSWSSGLSQGSRCRGRALSWVVMPPGSSF